MKNLKTLALIAFSVITFASCSKKDDAPAPAGSFTYDSQTYSLTNGYYFENNGHGELGFINADFTSPSFDTSAKYTAVDFDFDFAEPPIGTYEYKIYSDANYDKTKNFSYGDAFINIKISESPIQVKSGTVILSKSGSTYTVTFDVVMENDKPLKGSFTGPVTIL
ncbi:hypothetical protein SAMN05421788_103191 [Filimonas lacunae]|uniref:Uncharacterized protein n=1 Tax=Filimonas lacunae TaxID=477680 RepID=A0A173MK45_9BACT|nr:hypothetical protein [Filimonas lacunae]BAV07846.1 hypothetical protein FLA_3877 [Filimonas lacunae]SIT05554.1 hypothetical protein SAMN05421788_103191 [Filimonas lacunae]